MCKFWRGKKMKDEDGYFYVDEDGRKCREDFGFDKMLEMDEDLEFDPDM